MDEKLKEKYRKFDNNFISSQIANEYNRNLQSGTDSLFHGMELFRDKSAKLSNVGYEQAKGNLFEYIEGAKFARNNANEGFAPYDKFAVTDLSKSKGGFGEHTAPDDFRLVRNDEVIVRGQAKVNNDPNNTANNFLNSKYDGMQRITTVDTIDDVKQALYSKLQKGEISQKQYDEVISHIRRGLTDDRTGINSGGTSKAELEQFRGKDGKIDADAVIQYSHKLELEQMALEIGGAAYKGAATGAVMSSVVTGVHEFFEVYKDRKSLKEALKNTGLAAKSGAVRGGITGMLSSAIRIFGQKNSIPVLSNSSAATTLAAGVVDCGVSIYAYINGEIDDKRLVNEIKGTVVKSASAYYFTTALQVTVGVGSGVFIPMAIYSITSSMIMATKSIIEQAKLNAEQYRKATELLNQEYVALKDYRNQLNEAFKTFREDRKIAFDNFISSFDNAAFVTLDYSAAISSIVILSNHMQYSLQHKEFAEFKLAMNSSEKFVLK